MSFDLFLQRFESGESAQAGRIAVREVLRDCCKDPSDQFGFYNVKFRDGSHVEFSARGLESSESFTGCAFHIRGMSPEILSFVFTVAVVGDIVIFNAQGGDEPSSPLAILTSASQRIHLPEGAAANPVLCDSVHQLAELLGVGFEQWETYRDSVIGRIYPLP